MYTSNFVFWLIILAALVLVFNLYLIIVKNIKTKVHKGRLIFFNSLWIILGILAVAVTYYFWKRSTNYAPYLFVIAVISLLLDFYTLKKWKDFVIETNKNKLLYVFAWTAGILIAFVTAYALYLRATSKIPSFIEKFLFLIPTVWYLPKVLITPVLLVSDIVSIVRKLFVKKKEISGNEPEEINQKRRKLIQTAGWSLTAVPYLVVGDGYLRTTRQVKIKSVVIPVKNLPFEFDNFKLVQISDIHAGSFSSPKIMEDIVWMVRIFNPDLLLHTGDFVNFHPGELSLIEKPLAKLEAKYGVFGCFGNHDHYMTPKLHKELHDRLSDCGINLLINSTTSIKINQSVLQLAGVDNTSYKQDYGQFDKTFEEINSAYPTILLCHDPTNWDREIRGQRPADIMLSGHTHGGQIGIELFGTMLTPARLAYKEFAGLYTSGDQQLYVNTGIGTVGPPVRIGIYPELTFITLKSSEKFA